MNAKAVLDKAVREVGKGPLPLKEWGAIHDDVGGPETASVNEPRTAFDCYRCRERLQAEAIDERKGNDLVAMLLIGVLGVIVGIIIGVSL